MSQPQRKIRLLVRGLEPSPALEHVFHLANWLADDGWHVEIIAPDYHGMEMPYPLDEHVRLTLFGTQEVGSLRRRVTYFAFSVWRVCRGTDVAVATSWHAAYFIFIGRLVGPQTKLVYLVQEDEPAQVRAARNHRQPVQGIRYWLAKLSYRLPLRKLAASDALKRQTGNRAVVLPVGKPDSQSRYLAYFDGLCPR